MIDYSNCPVFTLEQALEVLELKQLDLLDECKIDLKVNGFASLKSAKQGQLSFWVKGHSLVELRNTQASYVLVPENSEIISELNAEGEALKSKTIYIQVSDPYSAMIDLLEKAKEKQLQNLKEQAQIHLSAKVHPTAVVEGAIEANVVVGPNCFVAGGSIIEEGSILESGVQVYSNVRVGKNCVLQAGCVIGSRGFGFRQANLKENKSKSLLVVPHFGGVVLSDEVQIGANSVVAAGFLEPTLLGKRSCIDSLVQIGHNVTLGSDCYMASQSGIAGSTTLGNGVRVAGGAQIAGHLELGDGVTVTAKAGVTRSIKAGMTVSGYPAMEHSLWKRLVVKFRRG